jgi:hypothetical protein
MAERPISSMIVILDIERFGERPEVVARELRTSMYQIVRQALDDAHVDTTAAAFQDNGDGALILLPHAGPVELTGAFVRELESLVRQRARSRTPEYRMRLRVAVQSGFVVDDGNGWVGSAIVKAARLVDADPLRAALRNHPDAHITLIVSDEFYRDVVAQGYASIDAAAFQEVSVQVKEMDTTAWIHTPVPASTPAEPAAAPPTGQPPTGGSWNVGNQFTGPVTVKGNLTGQIFER